MVVEGQCNVENLAGPASSSHTRGSKSQLGVSNIVKMCFIQRDIGKRKLKDIIGEGWQAKITCRPVTRFRPRERSKGKTPPVSVGEYFAAQPFLPVQRHHSLDLTDGETRYEGLVF